MELYLNCPTAAEGLCDVVPTGRVIAEFPVNIGLFAIAIVGSPLAPVPLVTVI